MTSAFTLMKLSLGEFANQSRVLRIGRAGHEIWLAPNVTAAAALVGRGMSRGRIWTLSEMTDVAEPRQTVAGLIAEAAGLTPGDGEITVEPE